MEAFYSMFQQPFYKNQSSLHDARVRESANTQQEKLLEVDECGSTALHKLCGNGTSNLRVIQALLSTKDGCRAASHPDMKGDTPLHVACRNMNADERVVILLLAADPLAASTANRDGLMPLHVACECNARNKGVIERLVQAYPLATCVQIKVRRMHSSSYLLYMILIPVSSILTL
jgi:hypothetical protein